MIPQHPDDWNQDYPIRDTDLSRSFEKFKDFIKPYYHKGQRYEMGVGGFLFRGKTYRTLQEIYTEIDLFLNESEKHL